MTKLAFECLAEFDQSAGWMAKPANMGVFAFKQTLCFVRRIRQQKHFDMPLGIPAAHFNGIHKPLSNIVLNNQAVHYNMSFLAAAFPQSIDGLRQVHQFIANQEAYIALLLKSGQNGCETFLRPCAGG